MKGVVYLGGPIDSQPGYNQSWREVITDAFNREGIVAFNPVTAINWPEKTTSRQHEFVRHMNLHTVLMCDVLVAKDPHMSVGAARELQVAVQNNKPTVVLLDLPNASPYLTDPNIIVLYTIEEVVRFITDQFLR